MRRWLALWLPFLLAGCASSAVVVTATIPPTPTASAFILPPTEKLRTTATQTPTFPPTPPEEKPTLAESPMATPSPCAMGNDTPSVYLDYDPVFMLRDGPGCEYPPSQTAIEKKEPLMWFPLLAQHGDWLLVNLCNGHDAWVYRPAIHDSNIHLPLKGLAEATAISVPSAPAPTSVNSNNLLPEARATLLKYIQLFYAGRYQDVVPYYGAGFGMLINWNEGTIDPQNYASLLQAGCETNGLICKMKLLNIEKTTVVSDRHAAFQAQMKLEDYYDPTTTWNRTLTWNVIRDCDGSYFVVDRPLLDIENSASAST